MKEYLEFSSIDEDIKGLHSVITYFNRKENVNYRKGKSSNSLISHSMAEIEKNFCQEFLEEFSTNIWCINMTRNHIENQEYREILNEYANLMYAKLKLFKQLFKSFDSSKSEELKDNLESEQLLIIKFLSLIESEIESDFQIKPYSYNNLALILTAYNVRGHFNSSNANIFANDSILMSLLYTIGVKEYVDRSVKIKKSKKNYNSYLLKFLHYNSYNKKIILD
ncbi:MAG: hypothetical protein ACTTGJ_03670 [Clostridium sp.]